nr:AraC family transcriptional regulator [uncultured Agathobaculum sp.]
MKVLNEAGVLSRSERFFATPSTTARGLFFYVTRVGHYYYDERYNFLDSSEVAHQESHKNFFLAFVRAGTMYFETTQVFAAERGQVALIDCHKPHRFFTTGQAESMWIHFDGANSDAFFHQILAFRNGKQTFTPASDGRIEQDMAQIISGLRSASMTEVDCSQRIYRILCSLMFPAQQQGCVPQNDLIAKAIEYIGAHLFEPLSVRRVADAVNLSSSHFSRLFRSTTGFSPHEYIMLHRIDEAKALLQSTTLSVKEIAFRVGYHSEVNFITAFTRKTGSSPTQFRRNTL